MDNFLLFQSIFWVFLSIIVIAIFGIPPDSWYGTIFVIAAVIIGGSSLVILLRIIKQLLIGYWYLRQMSEKEKDVFERDLADMGIIANTPRLTDIYQKRDALYDALIEVDGCGPKTAEKILIKIDEGRRLTDRERKAF